MVSRISLMARGAIVGLVMVTAPAASPSATVQNRLEILTFSGPVGLPGVTLARGSYTFEVANPESSAIVVRVRSRATDEVVFQSFTRRGERPKGMRENRSVMFGEAGRDMAPPILGWYPIGEESGHQFVYPGTR